jgi:hypothetical protein
MPIKRHNQSDLGHVIANQGTHRIILALAAPMPQYILVLKYLLTYCEKPVSKQADPGRVDNQ